jgi:hypothetical protein
MELIFSEFGVIKMTNELLNSTLATATSTTGGTNSVNSVLKKEVK